MMKGKQKCVQEKATEKLAEGGGSFILLMVVPPSVMDVLQACPLLGIAAAKENRRNVYKFNVLLLLCVCACMQCMP